MITPEDSEFHERDPSARTWAETRCCCSPWRRSTSWVARPTDRPSDEETAGGWIRRARP